ncbi:hypothetical protein [Luteimonas fraxinea]|uniref:hypothetical protein n=1 Tax=Luteimonas fraxinea TaxID=2901869 RepID=UPI001E2B583B|nr:hypothetical protein [Luteimonas fraxinea]MCD9126675.1 hypothetical protein [Luteimonas fraxinea]
MAANIVNATDGNVLKFPRAKKRGRKVLKGPSAVIVPLFPESVRDVAIRGDSDDSLQSALIRSALRCRREQMAIDANPKIIRFPESRRVARDGDETSVKSPLDFVLERLGHEVDRKVDAILAAEQEGL